MLVTPDFGTERWKIVRNLSEYFLGTSPIGETWKLGNVGVEKGAATRPRDTFLSKFAFTKSGWAKAVGRFHENLGERRPEKPILAPSLNVCNKLETKTLSGWSAKEISSLFTLIGVWSDPANSWFAVAWGTTRFGGTVDLLTSPSIGFLVLIPDISSFVAVPTAVPSKGLALTSITDRLVLALVPTTGCFKSSLRL